MHFKMSRRFTDLKCHTMAGFPGINRRNIADRYRDIPCNTTESCLKFNPVIAQAQSVSSRQGHVQHNLPRFHIFKGHMGVLIDCYG